MADPLSRSSRTSPIFRGFGLSYRCVLVEDEDTSRARLRRLLSAFPEQVEIVGEAADGPSAVALIQRMRPNLLFLDIDLPGFGGFEVLERIELQPAVIFTTAYNDYALRAFRTFAIDYLLKPIDEQAIGQALEKLRAMGFNHAQLTLALKDIVNRPSSQYLSRIQCKVGDRTVFVNTADVLYFKADNKLTAVFTSANDYLIDNSIVELVTRLDAGEFVQIHRATLVNIDWIAETRRSVDGRYVVVLKDSKQTELSVGRHFINSLKKL